MPRSSKSAPAAKISVGDIVHDVFLDHAESADDAIEFECFGRVGAITKDAYKVYVWRYTNDEDRKSEGHGRHNEDSFAIVKKAIKEIKRLK